MNPDRSIPSDLADAPGHAKLCYRELDDTEDPLSARDVCQSLHISRSTAYDALNYLIDEGYAQEVSLPNDAQRTYFSLV